MNLFKKYTKIDIDIIKIDGRNVNKSFIDTRQEIDYKIPSYEIMIKEMIELIRNNQDLYQQYMDKIDV